MSQPRGDRYAIEMGEIRDLTIDRFDNFHDVRWRTVLSIAVQSILYFQK